VSTVPADWDRLEVSWQTVEFGGTAMSVLPVTNELGEGPIWHPLRHELLWFDILRCDMYRLDLRLGATWRRKLPEMASAGGWIDEDKMIIGAGTGVYRLPINAEPSLLANLPNATSVVRTNDGRVDPWGRLWIGTMGMRSEPGAGALYRVEEGGSRVEVLKSGVTVPNCLAFSPDRRHGYFTDSHTRRIVRFDLDSESGTILGENTFAEIDSPAISDGGVVDADGCLWTALWDGGRLVRFTPAGKVDRTIRLPVRRPTCPAFGGADFGTLFVSSARRGVGEEELQAHPYSGGLFGIDGIAIGCPENRFG
jgi:sugar lactone lactonase YvrE